MSKTRKSKLKEIKKLRRIEVLKRHEKQRKETLRNEVASLSPSRVKDVAEIINERFMGDEYRIGKTVGEGIDFNTWLEHGAIRRHHVRRFLELEATLKELNFK